MKLRRSISTFMSVTGSSALLLFIFLISTSTYPLDWRGKVLLWFTGLDPWLLINHIYLQRSIPDWAWIAGLTVLSTLLWGRVFCSWICPLGALLKWIDKLGLLLPKRLRIKKQKALEAAGTYRYYWLFCIAVVFLLSSNWALFVTPFTLLGHELVRILFGTIPWVLIIIILATLLLGRFWCTYVCPTGLLLALIGRVRLYGYKTNQSCTQCGKCTVACPVAAAPGAEGHAREWCLVCGDCVGICPQQSIQWRATIKSGSTRRDPAPVLHHKTTSRRQFMAGAAVLSGAVAIWEMMQMRTAQAHERVLRPPGAQPEAKFSALCDRCGRCIKVCPTRALWAMPLSSGWIDFETPQLIPRRGSCDLCLACQEVCPTGALTPIPVEEVKIGRAVVDQSRCLAWRDGKLCFLCGEYCPYLAIACDDMTRPWVMDDLCIGCGACEYGCPVEGVAAIRVFPLKNS